MVKLSSVRESNETLQRSEISHTAFFVGATSGLGLTTLTEYARRCGRSTIYIVGRNDTKLSKVISDLKAINPKATYNKILSEYALFKEVDTACKEFQAREEGLDLLFMSPGYLKPTRQPDNADGLEETISLRYYVRMRFVHNLLPQLSARQSSRIVSIHGAGKEGRLNEQDLELKHTYSMQKAAMHTSTMNSLALEAVASAHPTISCVHVFPGLVITPGFHTFSEDWYSPARFLWRGVMAAAKTMTIGLPESGERHLFHSTSARYPPAGVRDPASTGVALPSGVSVALGSDGKEGSGCYLLNWDGETIGDQKLLADYREKDMGKRIWEHTHEIFNRAVAKQ